MRCGAWVVAEVSAARQYGTSLEMGRAIQFAGKIYNLVYAHDLHTHRVSLRLRFKKRGQSKQCISRSLLARTIGEHRLNGPLNFGDEDVEPTPWRRTRC